MKLRWARRPASHGSTLPMVFSTHRGPGPFRQQFGQEQRCQECSSPRCLPPPPRAAGQAPVKKDEGRSPGSPAALCTWSACRPPPGWLALDPLSLNTQGILADPIVSQWAALSPETVCTNKQMHTCIFVHAHACRHIHTCTCIVNVAPKCHTDAASTLNSFIPNWRQV